RDRRGDHFAFGDAQARVYCCLLQRLQPTRDELAPLGRKARLAQPVEGQGLVDRAGSGTSEDEPRPQVPVFRPTDRLVEAAYLDQSGAAHGGEPEDEVAYQDL